MKTSNYSGDYYLGFDCGTSSVGWSVTDINYNVLEFNNKRMEGVRLFDPANTAKDRRVARCARRRNDRKRQRIDLLQELFAPEINKVDSNFFKRLEESKYFFEDKSLGVKYALFADKNYTDKEYYDEYPTIYHLRKDLIYSTDYHDPRLVYLAIHHIVKNRGHFLFPGEGLQAVTDASTLLKDIEELCISIFNDEDFEFYFNDYKKAQEIFRMKKPSERIELLKDLCTYTDKKKAEALIKVINGYKVNVKAIFPVDEENEDFDKLAFEFKKASFEDEDLPKFESLFEDEDIINLIVKLKAVYDYILLADILNGSTYISEGKVRQYEENKKDLADLKYLFKKYLSKAEYETYFHSDTKDTYSSYIGVIQDNRQKLKKNLKRAKYEDFIKYTKKLLDKITPDESDVSIYSKLKDKVEGNPTLLPLLISTRNSVIPYQLNLIELRKILSNASLYLPFLNDKNENNISIKEKIELLLKFRIPYYIGPLTNSKASLEQKKFSWIERKADGKIYPWNFYEKVDKEKSAEGFIRRMTNKCTYMPEYNVIPKYSLLYSKFTVLNEINKLSIDGVAISVEQKQQIYNELFKTNRKVSAKRLKDYVKAKGWSKNPEIKGIDGDPKSSLASYYDFHEYLETDKLKRSEVEQIIEKISLFGDDNELCVESIKKIVGDRLNGTEIKSIASKKYPGWGTLSKEFLVDTTFENKRTGEISSIISIMWNTNENLMEVIHDKDYDIASSLTKQKIEKLEYSVVDNLHVSPSVKRQIWQTLKLAEEIEKIMKKSPKKIFVEVTRGDDEKKKKQTPKSRKTVLLELYDAIKKEGLFNNIIDELSNTLERYSEQDISRQDKLYLYFSQMGRCMYSGEIIDINDLYNTNIYDIDHIYPQSVTGDDSLSNRVLVLKTYNGEKSNQYPISSSWRSKMSTFWRLLYNAKTIDKIKYERLTRSTPLTDDELQGFINRQLVEVNQSTKATIDILKRYFGDDTEVVYSKARNVSFFRDRFDIPKSRILNDFHHAKDAYLNIVVGNIYTTKFTSNYWMFIDNARKKKSAELTQENKGYYLEKWQYNLIKMFEYSVPGAWVAGNEGTIKTVQQECLSNKVLITRQVKENNGALFDLQPLKAGEKKGMKPLKKDIHQNSSTDKEWTDKYGGYNSMKVSYFIIASFIDKKKRIVQIFPCYNYVKASIKTDADLENYLISEFKINEPKILVKKLSIFDLFEYKGVRMRVSSRTGSGILTRLEQPLLVDPYYTEYIHKIEKAFASKQKNNLQYLPYNSKEITPEKNLELYDLLTAKANNQYYQNRPSAQGKNFSDGRETFINLAKINENNQLDLSKQLEVLKNMINYFSSNPGENDFTLIGGSSRGGGLSISDKIVNGKNSNNFVLITQSCTGLFEKRKVIR